MTIRKVVPATHHSYWVYILSNRKRGTLYIGVTNSLERRIWQHRQKQADSFTRRYGLTRLMYFEEFRDVTNAIARETELKGWLRERKIALIERGNPDWDDLSAGWYSHAWILRFAQNDKRRGSGERLTPSTPPPPAPPSSNHEGGRSRRRRRGRVCRRRQKPSRRDRWRH
jgi:putative endonuclease